MTLITEETASLMLDFLEDADTVAVDTETFGLLWHEQRLIGLALAWEIEHPLYHNYYIPVRHNADLGSPNMDWGYLETVLEILRGKVLLFHNAKFDLQVLENEGWTFPVSNWYDSMVMAHLVDENQFSFGLKELGQAIFGIEPNEKKLKALVNVCGGYSRVPPEGMEPYATLDVITTWRLFHHFWPQILDQDLSSLLYELNEYSEVLRRIERNGLKTDLVGLKQALVDCRTEQAQIEIQLGFNPRSRTDLIEFFVRERIPFPLTIKGNPNLNAAFLDSLDDPRAKELRRWRVLEKATSTYYGPWLDKADEEGRLHPTFKIHGTKTGRLSCAEPNLQQIPREESDVEVKKFFDVSEGYSLWELDYAQIEFRLATAYGSDESLKNAVSSGLDIHSFTAEGLGISRYAGKTLNFSVIYGGGRRTVSRQLGIPEGDLRVPLPGTAAFLLSEFRSLYPGIFIASNKAEALARRGRLKNWCGRRRRFEHPTQFHKAFNSLIQGGAADILRQSITSLANNPDFSGRIVGLIHDSILVEIPIGQEQTQLELIRHEMCDWATEAFGIPFTVDFKNYKTSAEVFELVID